MGSRSAEDEASYLSMVTQLRVRFPELEPISRPPPLVRVNGIGVTVIGQRDKDVETGTYVKTLAVTLIWIPVFLLRAYRVADAPNGGWQFLGREPLSDVARVWNFVALPAIVALLVFLDRH
jgi:hypothetical protein